MVLRPASPEEPLDAAAQDPRDTLTPRMSFHSLQGGANLAKATPSGVPPPSPPIVVTLNRRGGTTPPAARGEAAAAATTTPTVAVARIPRRLLRRSAATTDVEPVRNAKTAAGTNTDSVDTTELSEAERAAPGTELPAMAVAHGRRMRLEAQSSTESDDGLVTPALASSLETDSQSPQPRPDLLEPPAPFVMARLALHRPNHSEGRFIMTRDDETDDTPPSPAARFGGGGILGGARIMVLPTGNSTDRPPSPPPGVLP